jgi:hypothetical protein
MGRSQRHKVHEQGWASDGTQRANDVVGNTPVDGADGGPLQGSLVQGPDLVLPAPQEGGWDPPVAAPLEDFDAPEVSETENEAP